MLVAVVGAMSATTADAQQRGNGARPELRVEVIDGRPDAVHALPGVAFPLGGYVRLGLSAGGGVARDSSARGSGRAELVARFLFDPYAQSRWGLSAGGGIVVRADQKYGLREYLVLVLDVEGPPASRLAPFVQAGLGGGWRLGVGLRSGASQRR